MGSRLLQTKMRNFDEIGVLLNVPKPLTYVIIVWLWVFSFHIGIFLVSRWSSRHFSIDIPTF